MSGLILLICSIIAGKVKSSLKHGNTTQTFLKIILHSVTEKDLLRKPYRTIPLMILNRLNKILAHGVYFKLILFSFILQLASLFRSYPLDHPCGRVLNITRGMEVLINCDSAVYMKDAQSPSRLFNGESVYQDRPLPTLLVSVFAKLWHFLDLPDYYRNIIGNSGIVVTYSLVTYAFFLILSTTILGLTCWLGIKTFDIIFAKFEIDKDNFALIAFLFTILVSMNEITKTFFWTPGSQMFNLLIPVYLFYLTQFANTSVSTKFFMVNILVFLLLLFSYAFFILMVIPLVLLRWRSFILRVAVVAGSTLIYAIYPSLLSLSGGTYNNFAIGYRRMFVWVFDSYFDSQLIQNLAENFLQFVNTFPIIPILIIVFVIFKIAYQNDSSLTFFLSVKSEFSVLLSYTLILGLYGYYSRRLTYPIVVLLFIIILKIYIRISKQLSIKKESFAVGLILLFVTYSWVFTSGPLM